MQDADDGEWDVVMSLTETPAKNRSRVTLKEVARLAGVSVSTASLVLSGKSSERRISAEAERRVREVARERDYAPNLLVRSLQRGRTHVLSFYSAFHFREAGDLYMDRLTSAIERAAGARHYDVLISCDFTRPVEELYRFLNGGRADGLLFFGPNEGDPLLQLLSRSRLPTVILNHVDRDGGLSYVSDDMADGIRQIADTLIELGHRRIAAITGPPVLGADSPTRISALRALLAEHGIAIPDRWVIGVYDGSECGPTEALERLLSEPEPPTALYCWHDRIGYQMLEACDTLGVAVPEQLSLVGYDGLHWPSTSPHVLASVGVDLDQLAETAVGFLDALVQGKEEAPLTRIFPVSLTRGTTLAPPSVASAAEASLQ